MILSIFDLIYKMFSCVWSLISWIADLSLRFISALLSFGMKGAGAVIDLLMTPFTLGADRLLDWTSMDLRGLFALVLWVLLGACVLLAIFAAGSNFYRRYRHKL